MKKEEQTVHPKKVTGTSQKQSPSTNEAEQRVVEQPGKEASVAAELKNRKK